MRWLRVAGEVRREMRSACRSYRLGYEDLEARRLMSAGDEAVGPLAISAAIGEASDRDANGIAIGPRVVIEGSTAPGAIVLLSTGFARFWPDRARYMGTTERGQDAVEKLHFPGLHPDAASWLVDARAIHAVGLDTPSIDHGPSTTFETHRRLLGAGVPAFENLTGLDRLPPTGATVLALPMKIKGGSGGPLRAVAVVPPDLVPCSVEKVAINAVMAGCKPEYLPVVLAAVEAVCNDTFNIHGVLATTMGVGPIVVVNGPIRRALGMNSGINALGQGNRANSTIGRALQLVVRNVGGGRPGEVDRATYGNPGKIGLAFAEDEETSPWPPLASDFGIERGKNAVTVFAASASMTRLPIRTPSDEAVPGPAAMASPRDASSSQPIAMTT